MLKLALIVLVALQVVQWAFIAYRALRRPGLKILRFRRRDALTYGVHYALVVWVLLAVLIGGYQP